MLINCDLGEWESREDTRELMAKIDAANVACGGHAGSVETLCYCHELAEEWAIKMGAHPGMAAERGRGDELPTRAEFVELLKRQVGIYQEAVGNPHHVKLHGTLYHAVEKDEALADLYAQFLEKERFSVFSLAGGRFSGLAKGGGLTVYEEVFADRGYQDDGTLIPRSEEGAVLDDVDLVRKNVGVLKKGGLAQTICVHSDSPHVSAILDLLRAS